MRSPETRIDFLTERGELSMSSMWEQGVPYHVLCTSHLGKKPPCQTCIRCGLSQEWLGSSAVVLLSVSTSLPDLVGI